MTDRELVLRTQAGDGRAFDELVLRHQDRLYTAVFRFCGHAEDAADVCQRAFINAFRKIAEFEGGSAFSTWVYRIAFNQAITLRREAGRRHAVPLSGTEDDPAPDPAVEAPPDEGLEARDRSRIVQEALLAIDPEERRIIVLKDIDDRSYEEIAEILGVPKGTVRSRLHRARLSLKERLKAQAARTD